MKLLKVLVAAVVMAAMVTPAIAEDRLSLSGSLQVRGFITDYDIESGYAGNAFSGKTDDSAAWNDMRMRIGGKIAVAEGVSVNFRFDTSESNENSSDPAAWGSTNPGSAYRYTQRRADIQFDLAYLQIEKNGFTLKAGELYHGGFGLTRAFHDSTAAGFIVKYGNFTIDHSKNAEENLGNETLDINPLGGDSSTTAAEYVFKTDGFSLTPIVAYTADDTVNDEDIFGLGLVLTTTLGPVALKGEIDYFDGENGLTNTDLKGLQFYLDGSIAAGDTVKLGFQGLYAEGQDAGDGQVTSLTDDFRTDWAFVDFNPQSLGSGDFAYFDNFDILDPGKFHAQSGAGVVAAGLYADVKASDALGLKFSGMVFQTEDDDIADMNGFFLNAMASYKLMANTTLSSHLNYMSIDDDKLNTSDDAVGLLTTLSVSF